MQATEGCPLMMLLELICKVSIGLRKGKVVIYVDRKHLIKEMSMVNRKASDFVKDCGATKNQNNGNKGKTQHYYNLNARIKRDNEC